jgi:hypothetical protein
LENRGGGVMHIHFEQHPVPSCYDGRKVTVNWGYLLLPARNCAILSVITLGWGVMFTRRQVHLFPAALVASVFSGRVNAQQSDDVLVSIRADESVSVKIPAILLSDLVIRPDESDEAKELRRRAPDTKGAPIILIIVGAIAITQLVELIKEMLRQVYYGGVIIDMRSRPPTVTNDPKIPANMIFVIDPEGRESYIKQEQFSLDALKHLLKA